MAFRSCHFQSFQESIVVRGKYRLIKSVLRLLTNLIGITFCEKNVVFAPGSSSEEQPTRRLSPLEVVASFLLAFITEDEIFHLFFLVCFKLVTVI